MDVLKRRQTCSSFHSQSFSFCFFFWFKRKKNYWRKYTIINKQKKSKYGRNKFLQRPKKFADPIMVGQPASNMISFTKYICYFTIINDRSNSFSCFFLWKQMNSKAEAWICFLTVFSFLGCKAKNKKRTEQIHSVAFFSSSSSLLTKDSNLYFPFLQLGFHSDLCQGSDCNTINYTTDSEAKLTECG